MLQDVIEEMCKHVEKPLVFPLSNPTSQAEITAENAYKHSKGKCIFAGGEGSPHCAWLSFHLAGLSMSGWLGLRHNKRTSCIDRDLGGASSYGTACHQVEPPLIVMHVRCSSDILPKGQTKCTGTRTACNPKP